MKTLFLNALLALFTLPVWGQTVLFQQNFDAGGPVSQYANGSSPNVGQFNGINGPLGAVSIVNGALHFERFVSGTTGHFSRTTDFSPVPTSLYVQFDFEVTSSTTVAGLGALVFAVGSSFGNSINLDVPEIYARIGIGFTGQGYGFVARSIPFGGGGASSAFFTGKQTFTFVLNNTGYLVTYLQPGGGTKKLPNDTYDLWLGTSRVFTELPVLTPTQTMTDFKLRIDDDVYAAIFQFDNFLIRDITGVLPLELTHFDATAQADRVHLTWQTNTTDAATFTVERRTQTGEFIELGTLTATTQRTYSFTDSQPQPGLNYYRLRQTDQHDAATWSKLVEVRYEPGQPALFVLNNPTSAEQIQVRTHALDAPTYQLATLTGQTIPYLKRETPDGDALLLPQQPLPSGVYLLTAQSGTSRLTRRVLVK